MFLVLSSISEKYSFIPELIDHKWSKIGEIQKSADHHVTDQFRNTTIFFRDTRYHQEHGAKVRLSILGPSPELALAEIPQL